MTLEYLQQFFGTDLCNTAGLAEMTIRFFFNLAMVWLVVHFLYYP